MLDRHASSTAVPLGAWPVDDGFTFRLWAPAATRVSLVLQDPHGAQPRTVSLARGPEGTHWIHIPGLGEGALYQYRIDDRGPFPDPASRSQPQGVHGPSETVDPRLFQWRAPPFKPPRLRDLVLYELHVGTFTPEGTFDGAAERLDSLVSLGVNAVELMPVASCPGRWNWGYDGVSLFAPWAVYGGPRGLRRLVDRAHLVGLAVYLDVVYNHLGPDGNYLGCYAPGYFAPAQTPWGQAIAYSGPEGKSVREFFLGNAVHWFTEYRVDGLRLDATHAIVDEGGTPVLKDLAKRVRAATGPRPGILIAEDGRNEATLVKSRRHGGHGLDAVWADDLHHQLRVALTGEKCGYFKDYSGRGRDIARTLERGWFYCGQKSPHSGRRRGTDPAGIARERFVHCLQNHDQVGNRPMGDRLHHVIGLDRYRAASALLLLGPSTPLLFMGQEWAASSPFCYFTDHNRELGRLVTQGRRREFGHYPEFALPEGASRIPDPQAERTFANSRIDWQERERSPHREMLKVYRALIDLRRTVPMTSTRQGKVVALGAHGLAFRRSGGRRTLLVVVVLDGHLTVDTRRRTALRPPMGHHWGLLMSTEGAEFGGDPDRVELAGTRLILQGPATAVLDARRYK